MGTAQSMGNTMNLSWGTPARTRASRLMTIVVGILAFVLVTPQIASAAFSPTAEFTVKVNGIVYGAAHLNGSGRTIVGGSFTAVGSQPRSNVGAFLKSGYADTVFKADTDGIVYAVAASADEKTIYLGGTFTRVNGVPRANLAAVDAESGAVIEGWQADTNGAVRALEVYQDQLYVGGSFNTLDGVQKGRLVALDPSGNMRSSFVPKPNWTVRDLAVSSDGSKIYAVGGFTAISGVTRGQGAAELTTADGRTTSFDPSTGGGVALAVDVTPDGKRMFFSTENNNVFAYDPAVSNNPVWITKGGGDTQAIDSTDTEVFIGGHFRNITTYKVKRNLAASLNVSDGTVTAWDPHFSGDMGPWTIQVTSSMLVYGGDFGYVGGAPRAGMARFKIS